MRTVIRTIGLLVAAISGPSVTAAQAPTLDFAAGTGKEMAWGAVASFVPLFGDVNRVWAGLGVRAQVFGGEPQPFANRGPNNDDALDGDVTIDPAVWALNLAVTAEARIAGPVGIGFNLDLAGIGAGPTRRSATTEARVHRGNLFLYGNADRGALNSEYYVSVRASPRVRLRAGLTHFVLGYDVKDLTSIALPSPESRYQRFATGVFVGVRVR